MSDLRLMRQTGSRKTRVGSTTPTVAMSSEQGAEHPAPEQVPQAQLSLANESQLLLLHRPSIRRLITAIHDDYSRGGDPSSNKQAPEIRTDSGVIREMYHEFTEVSVCIFLDL